MLNEIPKQQDALVHFIISWFLNVQDAAELCFVFFCYITLSEDYAHIMQIKIRAGAVLEPIFILKII